MRAGALLLLSFCLAGLAACSSKKDPVVAVTPAEPVPESGCEKPVAVEGDDPCTAPLVAGTDRKCSYTFKGKKRSFLVHVPAGYDACAKSPLVIDAHGATETAEMQLGTEVFRAFPGGLGSGWRLVSDKERFVSVFPQGIGNVWEEADVDFILDVKKKLLAIADIDEAKTYLTGISNGAFLTYWTACRAGNGFAGYSVVSGAANDAGCTGNGAAPLVAFHAEGDSVVSVKGGDAAVKAWADANKCTGTGTTLKFGGAGTDERAVCLAGGPDEGWSLTTCSASSPQTTCEVKTGCAGGGTVTYCKVNAATQPVGGHILYFNDTKLSLAAASWEIFKASAKP
jgi:hypothetical protein